MDEPGRKEIGRLLRQRRTDLGLSQPQAGRLLGVTKWTVSAWEAGRYPLKALVRIARFLDRDIVVVIELHVGAPGGLSTLGMIQEAQALPDDREAIELFFVRAQANEVARRGPPLTDHVMDEIVRILDRACAELRQRDKPR